MSETIHIYIYIQYISIYIPTVDGDLFTSPPFCLKSRCLVIVIAFPSRVCTPLPSFSH